MNSKSSPLLHQSIRGKAGSDGFKQARVGMDGQSANVSIFPTVRGVIRKLLKMEWMFKWRPHGDSNPGSYRERAFSLPIKSSTYDAPSPLIHHSVRLCLCGIELPALAAPVAHLIDKHVEHCADAWSLASAWSGL